MERKAPPPGDPIAWSSDPRPPPPRAPAASAPKSAPPVVRVRLERQGRGGKTVTVIDGLPGHPEAIEQVARRLKTACGAGGTTKGRVVELQGDHRDRVVASLVQMGLPAKKAGG